MPTTVYLDPKVWGPHYWFFLHTLAMTYPHHPNSVTKKKYYEFIQNLPLFLPVEEVSGEFSKLIDKYSVTPYLDNRDSFVRWMFFIHNKINAILGKEQLLFEEAYDKYYSEYKPKQISLAERFHIHKHYIHFGIILLCLFFIYMYYRG
jgi:hypothetical protein